MQGVSNPYEDDDVDSKSSANESTLKNPYDIWILLLYETEIVIDYDNLSRRVPKTADHITLMGGKKRILKTLHVLHVVYDVAKVHRRI